jgi:hypothetical protein
MKYATPVKGEAGIWPFGSPHGVMEEDLHAGSAIAAAAAR